jgi:hypothetical protein
MNNDVADGMVNDLRGVDIRSLLAADMRTALNRVITSSASGNNGFNNCIGSEDDQNGNGVKSEP